MSEELESLLFAKLGRRRFLGLGATAAGMAAIAACGGSSTTPPTGPTGPDFKLGVVLPYSAVYAELGDSITKGMQMYFDKAGNQAGGRRIVMLKEDEQTGTQPAVDKTRKLVESDAVDMMTGYVQSPAAAAVRNYLDTNKVPTLVANAGVNSLSRAMKSTYIYRTSFSNWQPSHPMGSYVGDNIAKKVLLVYSNYGAGIESVASFKETFTGTLAGADVTAPFPNTSGDFSAQITKINQVNPDAIYVFMSGVDAANFLKQAAQTLSKSIKITGSGFFVEQDVLSAIGDAAPVGAVTGLHWALTLSNSENKQFTADFKKKFGKTADVFAVQGYDTAHVIVDSLNAVKGKTDDKPALMKAIAAASFNSPRGPFKFDANSQNPAQNIYIRKLVKDPTLGYTNQVIQTVPNVVDPGH